MKGILLTGSYLIIVLSLQGCFGGGNFATVEEEAETLRETNWVLDENRDYYPTLIFDKDLTTITGFTGCNTYSADLILKNYSFDITAFISTEAYCNDVAEDESDYFLRLSECKEFRLMKKNILLLKNRSGRILLRFKKQ